LDYLEPHWLALPLAARRWFLATCKARLPKTRASTQAGASQAGIEEQRRQFDVVQKLLEPYVTGGTEAFKQQQALVGVQGPEAQRAAISAIEQGPAFQALTEQGENALLQRASATGGLRGGNVQAALAQFRPQILSQLIEQQYGQLGGLAKFGQASAAGTGAAAQETGANVAQLLAAQGAATAGGQMAAGKAFASIPSAISGGLGIFSGLGGKF
jgi:hypothetical protein